MKNLLSISGSGTKLAGQFSFIYELDKSDKYDFDTIVGTSGGAIVAALYSMNVMEDVKELMQSFSSKQAFGNWYNNPTSFPGIGIGVWRAITGNTYLGKLSGLEKALKKYITKEVYKEFCFNSSKDCYVCAINNDTTRVEFLNLKQLGYDNCIKAIVASASLPIILKSQKINGKMYSDGGLTSNSPVVDFCRYKKNIPNKALIVWGYEPRDIPNPDRWSKSLLHMFLRLLLPTMLDKIDTQCYDLESKVFNLNSLNYNRVVIPAKGSGTLDFSKETIARNWQLGKDTFNSFDKK